MDIQAVVFIFILAFVVNFVIQIIDRKIIDRKLINELKRKQKEIKNAGKSVKIEEMLKEVNELYSKILPKQMLLLTISLTIFAFVLYILRILYSDKIIIPLPFRVPITNRYGIGAIGTYIVFSIPLSVLIKKLINKLSEKIKWLGE